VAVSKRVAHSRTFNRRCGILRVMAGPEGRDDEPDRTPGPGSGPATPPTDPGSGDPAGGEQVEPAAAGDDTTGETAVNRPRPVDGREGSAPSPEPGADEPRAERSEWLLFARDVTTSVLAVAVVGAYLFAVSGVWPPLVAVESESMVPNMQVNDLVFVMEEERFPGQEARDGVVTARVGATTGHSAFGGPGDVIVYEPDGNDRQTPIIHRAMFHVEAGERWYDRADPEFVGSADSCADLTNCPAPHAGFITKGDNNRNYDQVGPGVLSEPVREEWVVGTAEFRIPGLGWIRLRSAG
jgi:signal peptidase